MLDIYVVGGSKNLIQFNYFFIIIVQIHASMLTMLPNLKKNTTITNIKIHVFNILNPRVPIFSGCAKKKI